MLKIVVMLNIFVEILKFFSEFFDESKVQKNRIFPKSKYFVKL